ncbi:MAG: hypothetical protein LQ340_006558 [Diploschistes diacapsis]|nr:MAG: hypothetical protein LQ340_006558 [Diploschistes diacapsis]
MEAAIGQLHNLQSSGCSVIKCVVALAPAFVGCASAAAEEFINPIADISCIAAALNDGVNPPSSCVTCFDDLKNGTGLGLRDVPGEKRKIYLPLP